MTTTRRTFAALILALLPVVAAGQVSVEDLRDHIPMTSSTPVPVEIDGNRNTTEFLIYDRMEGRYFIMKMDGCRERLRTYLYSPAGFSWYSISIVIYHDRLWQVETGNEAATGAVPYEMHRIEFRECR